jgi:signal transduction histidine kinase
VTTDTQSSGERILVVAPTGADAHNLVTILGAAGLSAAACPDLSALAAELERGCGAVVVTEEAFNYPRHDDLKLVLNRQPPWSDIPLVMIVTGRHTLGQQELQLVGTRANVTLVERPLRRTTMLSTLQTALRARRRQYEIRDLLAEREQLLASLEQRVAQRTARLEELNAELEAFSYSVSHDLRGPLRSLETYARILCDEFQETLPAEGRHFAERIARNAEKMDRLMRDVLTYSRVARSEMALEALDLDQVLADVIDQYPNLGAAGSQIEIVPRLGWVIGHRASLTQCFSNLLENALKFVPADHAPHVRVFTEARGARTRVSVQDNGIGIDPAYHARIFGMFERVSSPDIPGTGIGLTIVKKAVERMGGVVGVESSLGQGARFWIELKSTESAATPAIAAAGSEQSHP